MMSSIDYGPFSEENGVWRRAVKPLYAENQVNDCQTQRTEQAMVLFAAVRAEHMVSKSTEESSTSLNPIASSHIKETSKELSNDLLYDPDSCYNQWLAYFKLPLLPHPQTLYSFLKHIEHYNFSHLNIFNNALRLSIKLDYSECYIHLAHKFQPLPNYFSPQPEGYYYYTSIPIPSKFSSTNNNISNTNPIIMDNLEDTYHQLVEYTLEGYDDTIIAKQHFGHIQLNTCYNKFLLYNHLPLLSHPQTIRSFLHYIYSFDYSPDNLCGYTLTISIKNDYSEAHIYLPFESKPLPNHFIIPAQAIWHYPNIQLKSNTSTPVFAIPESLDYQLFSTFSYSFQPSPEPVDLLTNHLLQSSH